MEQEFSRRDVIKKVAGVVGGATTVLVLPASWTKPVVESIIAPANAQVLSVCDGPDWVDSNGNRSPNDPRCPQPPPPQQD